MDVKNIYNDISGGGKYDLGLKIGKWIDVHEPFALTIKEGITYCGVYL